MEYLVDTDNNSSNIFEISCIKVGSKQPKIKSDKNNSSNSQLKQRNKNKIQIEKVDKLRYFGLSDEQIAEALDLPLEVVKQVDSE
ncbi:MAG: hypothetical protein RLZZ507_119 [Cyanobacteriota bacterium]|jgi:hypothetical protein